jgi:hypothetical protein
MSGRAHQLDVFRVVEEIIDSEITTVAVVDLLEKMKPWVSLS